MDSNQPNSEDNKRSLTKRSVEPIVGLYRSIRNRLLRYFAPNEDDDGSTHVTTSNLEEHRKQILEQARRHVKPHTATNSNVVRNSLIVGTVSIIVVLIGLYISVFRLQPTNNFYYQLSQLLPMPVGEISDHNINYDRVLFYFRAESRSDNFDLPNDQNLIDNANSKSERLEKSFLKAREATYIEALAQEQGVVVSDKEVESIISSLPLLEANTTDLDVVLKDFRGWTRNDLFRETRLEALKSSRLIPAQVSRLTQTTTADEFKQLAELLEKNGAETGLIKDIKKPSTHLNQAAAQLDPGISSGIIEADEGMYVLFKQDKSVRYVLVNSGLRKQLLETQAAVAESISCLSGVQFSDTDVTVTTEASYNKCLF